MLWPPFVGNPGVGRFLGKEFTAAWPVFMFFAYRVLLLILLVKLTLAHFADRGNALSNALVGVLIAAKAELLLDDARAYPSELFTGLLRSR